MVAAFLVMLVASACSDNKDNTLTPSAKDRYLSLEAEGKTTGDADTESAINFDLNAASKTITVTVTSNTLWKVEVDGGGWCSVDMTRGRGNGQFTISILNNRAEERDCKISVMQIDAEGNVYDKKSADIDIVQEGSQVFITPSSVDIFPAENAQEREFDIVANTSWTLSVRAESELTGNFITINPISGMEQAADGSQTFTGTGDAHFSIALQNNGMAIVRKAYLELKSENGNFSVEISQQKSEYTFDVSPNTTRYVAATGDNDLKFTVYSPMYGWSVIIPKDSWISCAQTKFDKSDQRVSVSMTAEPNLTGRERMETLYFKSDNDAYDSVPVAIVQSGVDVTFVVSLNDAPMIIAEDGGSFSFNVNSMFDWRVANTADWISVSPAEGRQSHDAVSVNLAIDKNITNTQREDSIKVIPLVTEFAGGLTIDPKDAGISPIIIPLKQYGGQRPAISSPWVSDGITEAQAVVTFNYYSPFLEITAAGLRWRKIGDTGWTDVPVNISNSRSGTVAVTLTGLSPVTRYEAYGYVVGSDGQTYTGSVTLPFTTAGRYPGSSDNPTPSR